MSQLGNPLMPPYTLPPLYQTQTGNNLLPSLQPVANPPLPTLGLNQIEGFEPVRKFVDNTNTEWVLVKAASDSSVDIPDPKKMQLLEYWAHEFPGLKQRKIYIYVVEGIRPPRVETERPTRILYQWFSANWDMGFLPSKITEKEWLKANVYAAAVIDTRVAKLCSLCKYKEELPQQKAQDENKLLQVEELTQNGTNDRADQDQHQE